MRFEQLKRHLEAKTFAPCYLIYGEESFFVEEIGHWFEDRVIPKDLRDFNQTVLYGSDSSMSEVVERARQLPMMYEYTTVIVRQAQSLIRQLTDLEAYLEHPNPQCILVLLIHSGSIDKRKKIVKQVDKLQGLYECKPLYENELPGWLETHLSQHNIAMDVEAKQLLLSFIGADLRRIKSEIEKIQLAVPDLTTIKLEHIEKYVGIHRNYNVFEMQKALSAGQLQKAVGILNYFSENSKDYPIQMTLPVLSSFFSKVFKYHALSNKAEAAKALGVSPYFIKDYQNAARIYSMKRLTRIMSGLKQIDLASKGVGQLNSANSTAQLYQELSLVMRP
jgi:DNA polymerase-3 subunit delta